MSNIVSINSQRAVRILRNIASIIDNGIEITIEEHETYIKGISRLLQDTTLDTETVNNLLVARQHLRHYSRFIGILKEYNGNLSR